jgi:hypothetical protein
MFYRKIKYEGDFFSIGFSFLFLFILSRIRSYSLIKSGSMPERMDFSIRRLRLFLFSDIFSVSFCMLIPDFKVRDMVLKVMNHFFHVKENIPNILERVFL